MTLFVWRSVGGPIPLEAKDYEIRGLFENASQLTPNADVRIAGVTVGSVTKVRSVGLRTEATLAIRAKYAPLGRDVRAILRQKTLLGEAFIALTPGDPDGPRMKDGGTIPVEHIEDTQPLDRVLSTLDADGRKRLQELLVDTGTMLDGRAQDISDAAGNLGTGARQLQATMELLDAQSDDVSALVARTGEVLQTVGDSDASVRRLVSAGNRALGATARRGERLTETVRAAPAMLRELRATAAAAQDTAQVAAPTLRAFKPLAPKIPPALNALTKAAPDLEGLLVGLERLTPTARRALPAAASIVDALDPFMDRLQPAAQQITPMLSYMAAYRQELVGAMGNVAASLRGRAPGVNGKQTRYIRTIIPLGPELLVGANGRIGSNRHNAYMAPGGLLKLKDGLPAANCANAGQPTVIAAPPCKVQEGWSMDGGDKRYFQRLTPRPILPEPVKRASKLFG